MSRIGVFDTELLPTGWFDDTSTSLGWFDDSLVEPAASGGTAYTLNLEPAVDILSAFSATLTVTRAVNLASSSFSISLSSTSNAVGRVLNAGTTSFNLTGYVVTLKADYALQLAPTSYTITSSPVTNSVSKGMNLEPASYLYGVNFTLTGYPVTFVYQGQAVLDAQPASFDFSYSPASFSLGLAASLGSASYDLIGSDITFEKTTAYSLNLEPAEDLITYYFVACYRTYEYSNDSTSYSLNGLGLNLAIGRVIDASPSSFSLDGLPASFYIGKNINLGSGAFLIEGTETLLSKNTRYPPEALVVAGTIYGDEAQFLGSYEVPNLIYDIDTGRFVKILSNKTGLSL